jgi:hypothetical protein
LTLEEFEKAYNEAPITPAQGPDSRGALKGAKSDFVESFHKSFLSQSLNMPKVKWIGDYSDLSPSVAPEEAISVPLKTHSSLHTPKSLTSEQFLNLIKTLDTY